MSMMKLSLSHSGSPVYVEASTVGWVMAEVPYDTATADSGSMEKYPKGTIVQAPGHTFTVRETAEEVLSLITRHTKK